MWISSVLRLSKIRFHRDGKKKMQCIKYLWLRVAMNITWGIFCICLLFPDTIVLLLLLCVCVCVDEMLSIGLGIFNWTVKNYTVVFILYSQPNTTSFSLYTNVNVIDVHYFVWVGFLVVIIQVIMLLMKWFCSELTCKNNNDKRKWIRR